MFLRLRSIVPTETPQGTLGINRPWPLVVLMVIVRPGKLPYIHIYTYICEWFCFCGSHIAGLLKQGHKRDPGFPETTMLGHKLVARSSWTEQAPMPTEHKVQKTLRGSYGILSYWMPHRRRTVIGIDTLLRHAQLALPALLMDVLLNCKQRWQTGVKYPALFK